MTKTKKFKKEKTKFFHFRQNNSGGVFRDPAINVIIEAVSAEEANALAEFHGLYFHGVGAGLDCDCCGDRWYPQWKTDGGDDTPKVYDKDPKEAAKDKQYQSWAKGDGIVFCRIFYKNGDVKDF